ncbi:hypothetical protein RJZ56_004360 [Blastomyces dermatitidis]
MRPSRQLKLSRLCSCKRSGFKDGEYGIGIEIVRSFVDIQSLMISYVENENLSFVLYEIVKSEKECSFDIFCCK